MPVTISDPDIGNLGETLQSLANQINAKPITLLSANGALDNHNSNTYVVTKASIAALTLAAPTAGADDGKEITVTSSTAFAHTLTATGLLATGSASVNAATFAAFAGAGLRLIAYNGKWNVLSSVGVTFS